MKLLAISGFVPEQICDVVRFTQYGGEILRIIVVTRQILYHR